MLNSTILGNLSKLNPQYKDNLFKTIMLFLFILVFNFNQCLLNNSSQWDSTYFLKSYIYITKIHCLKLQNNSKYQLYKSWVLHFEDLQNEIPFTSSPISIVIFNNVQYDAYLDNFFTLFPLVLLNFYFKKMKIHFLKTSFTF